MDPHDSADLGVLDELLDEVHADALREQDEEPFARDKDSSSETNALSPDDMLQQLDAVTLASGTTADDDDDLDPVAAFEDAHDEIQSVDEDDHNEAVMSTLDEQSVCLTTPNEGDSEVDGAGDMHGVDELSDYHDPTDSDTSASASDVYASDAADGASVAPSALSSALERNESAEEPAMATEHNESAALAATTIESMNEMTAPSAEDDAVELSEVDAVHDSDVERSAELDIQNHESLPDSSAEATALSPDLEPLRVEPLRVEHALDAVSPNIEDPSTDDVSSADRSVLGEAERPSDALVESEGDGDGANPPPLLRPSAESDASSSDADLTIHAPPDTSDPSDARDNSNDSEVEMTAVAMQASTESVAPDEVPGESVAPFAAQEERRDTERQERESVGSTQDAVPEDALASVRDGDDVHIQGPPLVGDEASEPPVFPPPAPLAVVVGSMTPSADDDDDSDSQDEDDDTNERAAPPPPLHISRDDDDDDDVLEVDPAVVETIQVEKQDAAPSLARAIATRDKDESALLAALPPLPKPLASSTDEIEFSFPDEIRVAHVTAPPVAAADALERKQQPPSLEPQSTATSSAVDAFGISYTSFKTKPKATRSDGADASGGDTYALPAAPAFPDEREFERELALSSDLAFSVKSSMRSDVAPAAAATRDGNGDDDDEFSVVTALDASEFSVDALDAKRASLEARTSEDEARVLQELKRATDAEKALNSAAVAPLASDAPSASALPAPEPESAMSLRELHGIYKRGLGDQSVLLLDDDDSGDSSGRDAKASKASTSSSASGTPLSVMGRILSKPSLTTHAITEEAEDADDDDDSGGDSGRTKRGSDGYGGTHDPHRERETLIDNGGTRNSSDRGSTSGGDEWREIQLATQSAATASSGPGPLTAPASYRISYAETLAHCLEDGAFLSQRDKIVPEEFAETGRSCFACFSPRPRLAFAGALDERDRVFCIAATSYAPQSDVFTRVLQTLYAKLTRTQRAVPLSGSHWEDIGFQGNDPSTDLRGCGVLSLVQMLYLVETFPELALRAQSLSQHPTRHFPLACVLINVTLQCITALRTGALYKECNKQASVLQAINTLYVAITAELMDEIQSSAEEVPVILQSVLEDGRSHPDSVIDEFAKTHSSHGGKTQQAGRSASAHTPPTSRTSGARDAGATIEFTEIALQSTASDGGDE